MNCFVYSSKPYDELFLKEAAEQSQQQLRFSEARLSKETAILAKGFDAVCCFVNDDLNREIVQALYEGGTRFIVLRCAGFNNVHLATTKELGMRVARVPAYSPHAVAEHTVGLILSLNRKIHKAYSRVRDNNFSLEGLMGFDLFGKCAGVVGTGAIGACVVRILHGFGCQVLMHDVRCDEELKGYGEYVSLEQIFHRSDILTLHCPLNDSTHHLIQESTLAVMKPGVMLINTSRGGLIHTSDVIQGLKRAQIGSLGLDVYEEESQFFFEDFSQQVVQDDVFSRLLTFPNVLITSHQAFFTREAMSEIARVTMSNLLAFESGTAEGPTILC